eukprot:499948-Ditylum_brightwellii.AAC.1
MDMTAIFQVPDLEGYTSMNCPLSYDSMDLNNIYKFFAVQRYMTDLQTLMQTIPFDYLPTTKDDIAIQTLAYKDMPSTLSNIKDFARNKLIVMVTKEPVSYTHLTLPTN